MAYFKNIFSWFLAPVETSTVLDWLISRVANLEEKCGVLLQKYEQIAAENEKLKKILVMKNDTAENLAMMKNDTAKNLG